MAPAIRVQKDAFMRYTAWFCLWLAFCLSCTAPASAGLRAGVGRAEITPPKGVPLGGYGDRNGAPSTGAHDPLYAKALALEEGGQEVIIATTDLIGISAELAQAAAHRAGVSPQHLLLCASHTHSGPGAFGKGLFAHIVLGQYDEKIFNLLAEGIATAIRQARDRLAPARFGYGIAQLPSYTRNRRGGDLIDPQLTVLRVDTQDGKPLAALFHYTTHGTVLGPENIEASGDWMGAAQRALETALPGVMALYANGAEGDQAPRTPDRKRGFEGSEALGQAVAAEAARVFHSVQTADSVKIGVRERVLPLPPTQQALLAGLGRETRLQVVELGEVLLVAIPGEMIVELGDRIKVHARAQGWKAPLIIGLANDHLGYLLTQAEYEKGGYEARISFFGPTFGDELALAAMRLIGGEPSPAAAPPPEAPEAVTRRWFAALPDQLRRRAPADFRGTFRFVIVGAGDWWAAFSDGQLTVRPARTNDRPAATLRAPAATWDRLLRRELSLASAINAHQVKVEGDVALALRLPELVRFRLPVKRE
ncbi:MAG: neutral/alkaline non-lysosomal ceramidase N-terminal domain-containing protein [Armatimonadetes bacterium]|nr:neutral/alkaline non-lysosomal ceramidase N-terminal domain-containing protein [Armatimonadota bacterium]